MKPKRCKVCKTEFQPVRTFQRTCSTACAVEQARATVKKKQRAEDRETKKRLKSRSDWMREAQQAFNKFIRLRDAALPCISCGRWHQGQWHASHYRSVGACPELRFDEQNVHKACSACNNHLSGNIIEYRLRLIEKIGQQEVDRLEGVHELQKLTIEEIRKIKALYVQKAKQIGEHQNEMQNP